MFNGDGSIARDALTKKRIDVILIYIHVKVYVLHIQILLPCPTVVILKLARNDLAEESQGQNDQFPSIYTNSLLIRINQNFNLNTGVRKST